MAYFMESWWFQSEDLSEVYAEIKKVDANNVDAAEEWLSRFDEEMENDDNTHAKDASKLRKKVQLFREEERLRSMTSHDIDALRDKKVKTEQELSALTREDKIKGRKLTSELRKYTADVATWSALQERQRALEAFEQKRSEQLLQVRRSQKLAVCFLVDCTSSMADCIDAIRKNIIYVATMYEKMYGDSGSLKLGFVGYRDFTDKERFEILPFTGDVDEFVTFVSKIQAIGGGDWCEDAAGGLQEAADMKWNIDGKDTTRVIIHVADAPPHGYCPAALSGSHNSDKYPQSAPPGNALVGTQRPNTIDPKPSLQILYDMRVKYFLFNAKPNLGWSMDEAIKFGNQWDDLISKRANTKNWIKVLNSVELECFADNVLSTLTDSVVSTAKETATAKAARATVRKTLHISMPVVAEEEEEEEDDDESDNEPVHSVPATVSTAATEPHMVEFAKGPWLPQNAQEHQVTIYNVLGPRQASQLSRISMSIDSYTYSVGKIKFDPLPFAAGEERVAHQGSLYDQGKWIDVVLKRFFAPQDLNRHLQALHAQKVARFVAEQYNATKRPSHCARVGFVDAVVVKMKDGSLWHLEKKLNGSFVKYNNNVGDWAATKLDESLLRFAMYSMSASKHRLMIADLQGCKSPDGDFNLTDPVVLTNDITEMKWMGTNWGKAGILAYTETTNSFLQKQAWKREFFDA